LSPAFFYIMGGVILPFFYPPMRHPFFPLRKIKGSQTINITPCHPFFALASTTCYPFFASAKIKGSRTMNALFYWGEEAVLVVEKRLLDVFFQKTRGDRMRMSSLFWAFCHPSRRPDRDGASRDPKQSMPYFIHLWCSLCPEKGPLDVFLRKRGGTKKKQKRTLRKVWWKE